MAVHLIFARLERPFLPLCEIGRLVGDVDEAGAAEAGFPAQLAIKVAPDFQAFHGKRQLTQVAMLLATPPPIPAALLAADIALVQKCYRMALFGEPVGGGGTGNAGADHDDIG